MEGAAEFDHVICAESPPAVLCQVVVGHLQRLTPSITLSLLRSLPREYQRSGLQLCLTCICEEMMKQYWSCLARDLS